MKDKNKKRWIYYSTVLLCLLVILNNYLFGTLSDNNVHDISYDVFLDQVYSMNVDTVEINTGDGYIYYTLKK